jgi:hypothetical protein
MRDDLRNFWINVVAGLFVSALLGVISFSGTFFRGTSSEEFIRFFVVGLYVALLVAAIFVLVAKQQSRVDPARRLPRFKRWTKWVAAASVVVGVLPLVWIFIPYSIAPLRIRVNNSSRYTVLVSVQAFFHIKLPETPVPDSIVERGRCQISWLTEPLQRDKPLMIFSGASADFKCQILNPIAFRRFIDSENMDIEVTLNDGHGNTATATMELNQHTLKNHWLLFEFKDQQRSF